MIENDNTLMSIYPRIKALPEPERKKKEKEDATKVEQENIQLAIKKKNDKKSLLESEKKLHNNQVSKIINTFDQKTKQKAEDDYKTMKDHQRHYIESKQAKKIKGQV